ncbi:MAG: flagellar biosynthesis protein FlhF [Desulfobacterales bacterium]|nr:flagellar biosynthesis protein FlhF [Desulfobacterales bacterium]
MGVKIYRAKSIQAAIRRIKADLGSDALILKTRRIPPENGSSYATGLFEVTASDRYGDKSSGITMNVAARRNFEDQATSGIRFDVDQGPEKYAVDHWEVLRDEILQIKDMFFLMKHSAAMPSFLMTHPEMLELYARLVKAGISESRAQAIIKQSLASAQPNAAAKSVVKILLNYVEVCDPFQNLNGHAKLAAFIGPTGVGKTTTIAKLAAELSLKRKKRVGIVAVDNYRIGAADQLKTYATIMGLPCLAAFTQRDLVRAIGKFRNKDVILIDTAGQSHLDNNRLQELAMLMCGDLPITSHLVLSAGSKSVDMKEITANFSQLKPQSYIFTKFDETRQHGAIIDQLCEMQLPISYVTNGQRVPEDLVTGHQRTVLRMILS